MKYKENYWLHKDEQDEIVLRSRFYEPYFDKRIRLKETCLYTIPFWIVYPYNRVPYYINERNKFTFGYIYEQGEKSSTHFVCEQIDVRTLRVFL